MGFGEAVLSVGRTGGAKWTALGGLVIVEVVKEWWCWWSGRGRRRVDKERSNPLDMEGPHARFSIEKGRRTMVERARAGWTFRLEAPGTGKLREPGYIAIAPDTRFEPWHTDAHVAKDQCRRGAHDGSPEADACC
jgi:hypothetical protein